MNPIKKLCVLAIVMMAGAFNVAMAADFEVDGICYNIIGDGEVEVTSPDSVKYAGEVFIPSTVVNNGTTYHVTRIGDKAFYICRDMTLVDIPEGITSIGVNAFYYCISLENVELPNSLVSIEKWAFSYCNALTSFHIPRNLALLAEQTLVGCTNLKLISCSSLNQHFRAVNGVLYSKDMTELYAYPIAALDTVFDVPSPVARIHEYCFCDCQSLVRVNFPETLRWIDMNIFRDCHGLESADIPDGVTHMGLTVFGGCSNLKNVHLPASLDSIMNSTFMMCDKLAELTIPRNVKYLGQYAFYRSGIKTLTFEEGSCLETIDESAFQESRILESIDIPNSVKTIGGGAFSNCSSLKSVHMSEGLTSIGISAFIYCPLLEEGYLPGGVTRLRNAFSKCENLKRMQIGKKDSSPGVTIIENCGIIYCNNIEYLELGANVDSLAHLALVDLENLKVLISWAAVPPRCNSYWRSFSPHPQEMSCVLYVPKASLEAYRTANEWKNFKTIVPIEDVGDVDGNGSVNVADVTELVDQLLTQEILNRALADVDLDGNINISDVTELIDKILSGNTN